MAKLTHRQEQLAHKSVQKGLANLSQVARALDPPMAPQNAHRMMKRDDVAKKVDRLKTRQLDKARRGADRAASVCESLMGQIQDHVAGETDAPLPDLPTMIEAARRLKDYEAKDREIADKFGGATKEEETLLWYRGRIRLAAARAIRYAALHPHRVDALLDRLEQQAEDYGRRLAELRASR